MKVYTKQQWGDPMDINFVRNRITQLRMQKGVSEYKMSLDLGRSKSYINGIALGKNLPSVQELLYICEYFGVTPSQFFDEHSEHPALLQKAIDGMYGLSDKDIITIISLIDRLRENDPVKR